MRFVVGAGPTELHAHIDLDHRLTAATQAATTSIVTVIEATSCNGHWFVLATVRPDTTDKGAQ